MSTRTTVMDSLRWENRAIPYISGPRSFTKLRTYYQPYKTKEWAEFTIDSLNAIEGGRMFRVASDTESLTSQYPFVQFPSGRTEASVTATIQATTFQVVQNALDAVAGTLPSCKWRAEVDFEKKKKNNKASNRDSQRSTPALNDESSSIASGVTLDISLGRVGGKVKRPDAGAHRPCPEHNSICQFGTTEIFPKDYKSPAWSSDVFLKSFLNEDGTWIQPGTNQELAWPIRQVYTYCVAWRCRYGCIITTREAFVFRIRPCTDEERRPHGDGRRPRKKTETLYGALREFGMMEYRSFRWNNPEGIHRDGSDAALTMNMALWSLHVLAAASHSIDWAYRCLSSETLPISVCNSTVPATPVSDTSTFPGYRAVAEWNSSSPLKRRREETEDTEPFDPINHSFDRRSSPIPRQVATPRSLRRRLRNMASEAPDDCENTADTANHDEGLQGDTQPEEGEELAPRRSASKRRRHLSSA